MPEKKEDLRIRRTHKLLSDAMFSLLETKSFDEITVMEICDKAMVHRATFYKHFEDKYAFMEYIAKGKIDEFYNTCKKHAEYDSPIAIYHQITENVFDFLHKNAKMLRISTDKSNSGSFLMSIGKIINNEILEFLHYSEEHGVIYDVPVEIISEFLTGGISSIVRKWLMSGSEYPEKDVIGYIETLLLQNKCFHSSEDDEKYLSQISATKTLPDSTSDTPEAKE